MIYNFVFITNEHILYYVILYGFIKLNMLFAACVTFRTVESPVKGCKELAGGEILRLSVQIP